VVDLSPGDYTILINEFEKRNGEYIAWLKAEFRETARCEPSDEYYPASIKNQLWELGSEPDRSDKDAPFDLPPVAEDDFNYCAACHRYPCICDADPLEEVPF
jgi:hypothetical protein